MESILVLAITVAFFNSVQELQQSIDTNIAETKTVLGRTLGMTEVVRKMYNEVRKDDNAAGKTRSKASKDTKQQEMSGFRVLINPTAEYELRLMEESVTTLQEKIDTFERVKELYPKLTTQNMKIAMILNDGVPSGFMFFSPNL